MTRTHNEAIALLEAGNEDQAWVVAQQDEGLSEGVTKEVWLAFAHKAIANRKACAAAYSFARVD